MRSDVLHKGVDIKRMEKGAALCVPWPVLQSGAYWIRICRCLLIRTFNGGRLMPNCGFSTFFSRPSPLSLFSLILILILLPLLIPFQKYALCAPFIRNEKKDAIIVVPLRIYNSCQSSHSSASLHGCAWTVIEYSVSFLFFCLIMNFFFDKYLSIFSNFFHFFSSFFFGTLYLRFLICLLIFPISFRLKSSDLYVYLHGVNEELMFLISKSFRIQKKRNKCIKKTLPND